MARPHRRFVVRSSHTVIVDTAHNCSSVSCCSSTRSWRRIFPPDRKVLVFAASKDKDVRGMLRQLVPEFDTVILTRYLNNPQDGASAEHVLMAWFAASATHRSIWLPIPRPR